MGKNIMNIYQRGVHIRVYVDEVKTEKKKKTTDFHKYDEANLCFNAAKSHMKKLNPNTTRGIRSMIYRVQGQLHRFGIWRYVFFIQLH